MLRTSVIATAGLLLATCATGPGTRPIRPPNVIVIVSDDQGYGDFGFMGNPVLRTPHLDALAAGSAIVEEFYVWPVCAPTRAALMTGRYPQRTRAFDTWIGRAMLDPAEVTLAERLRAGGYATGIFGKWHLGDCAPMRPIDQGFDEALVHRGGGIGQPSDPIGAEGRYTDPVLEHNGRLEPQRGYCTDVYFDAAIEWLLAQHEAGRPFFVYLPTNAPHGPFHDVPEELYEHYRSQDLSPARFGMDGEWDEDRLARIFAMIADIDDNVGRLDAALRERGIFDDTIVLYLNDNGPAGRRWTKGLRGSKATVFEGGVRTPLLARWPGHLAPGPRPALVAAAIDLAPTLLDACDVDVLAEPAMDGDSVLAELISGGAAPERALVIQANRGDAAVRHRNFLVRRGRYKLVHPSGFGGEAQRVELRPQLYDLAADPFEQRDLAAQEPALVTELVGVYDAWFDDVSTTRPDNFAPPPIHLGRADTGPVTLTRQDWRALGSSRSWGGAMRGHWRVDVRAAGPLRFEVRARAGLQPDTVTVLVDGEQVATAAANAGPTGFDALTLPAGVHWLEVRVQSDADAEGAWHVMITPAD